MLADDCGGRAVETVAGLAKDGELHPLQRSFVDHFATQCGFCTPGIVLRTKWLTDKERPLTRPEIARALDGHLCRCTGYIKYHEAVRDVILADPGRYLA